MKKRTLSLLLSIACVLSLSLAACGNETAAPSASPSAPVDTETPAAEVDQTREIVFAASRDQCPGEQDAYYASMSLGIWEPLITKDENNKPAPALATSWELKAERTSLNLLQHMSGISSYTNKCVELVKGTNASIADTRKTLPGLRPLQKYAVTVGGGRNHRYNLTDAAMLKDNHIDAYGGITAAVNALRQKAGHMLQIEVETRNLEEVQEAVDCGVNVSNGGAQRLAQHGRKPCS